MTTDGQDFKITAGDSWTISIALTDENGSPLLVAGAAATWQLAREPDAVELLRKATTDPDPKVVLSLGQAVVTGDPADTIGIEGIYHHRTVVVDSQSNRTHVTKGLLIVEAAVRDAP